MAFSTNAIRLLLPAGVRELIVRKLNITLDSVPVVRHNTVTLSRHRLTGFNQHSAYFAVLRAEKNEMMVLQSIKAMRAYDSMFFGSLS